MKVIKLHTVSENIGNRFVSCSEREIWFSELDVCWNMCNNNNNNNNNNNKSVQNNLNFTNDTCKKWGKKSETIQHAGPA